MVDLLAQEEDEKKMDDANGEDHNIEVEPTQPLPKEWRYAINHPKDLIIGDVFKWATIHSKLHDLCSHFTFISHIEPKNILKAEGYSYWLLAI